ncbi:MAG: hypothetical protein CM15mP18_0620 [Methanobacteriota archaeon]|nr:MAG: hypothetical protein CM15mP18_0620 [Euryarchaeota archaeon]
MGQKGRPWSRQPKTFGRGKARGGATNFVSGERDPSGTPGTHPGAGVHRERHPTWLGTFGRRGGHPFVPPCPRGRTGVSLLFRPAKPFWPPDPGRHVHGTPFPKKWLVPGYGPKPHSGRLRLGCWATSCWLESPGKTKTPGVRGKRGQSTATLANLSGTGWSPPHRGFPGLGLKFGPLGNGIPLVNDGGWARALSARGFLCGHLEDAFSRGVKTGGFRRDPNLGNKWWEGTLAPHFS